MKYFLIEEDKLFSEYIYTLCEKISCLCGTSVRRSTGGSWCRITSGKYMVNVELPRLMNNPNVTKITIIDSKTGIGYYF